MAILGLTDVTLQQVIDEWVNLHTPQWTSEKYKYTIMHRIELVTANLANRPPPDKAVWVIPAYRMKMRQERLVPLAPQPLAILRALHEII